MLSQTHRDYSQSMMDFIHKSPNAYHAVQEMEQALDAAGFRAYESQEIRDLEPGTRGYYMKNGSAIAAFIIGSDPTAAGFRMMGAHTDSPALKIKPNAVVRNEGILKLSTEVYGGPILNTWFDRPLSLAGRVALRSNKALQPEIRLIDFQDPILILPNVAIHMNRQVNDGVKIERQKVLLPFIAQASALPTEHETDKAATEDFFAALIASRLGVAVSDVLDYDLYTYDIQEPVFVGLHDEFVNSPRLDNLAMCWAGLQGLIHADVPQTGINLVFFSDHEEVGSGSKQGAASTMLRDLMELLVLAIGGERADFLSSFDRSFMISADLAHAVHPNYSEYSDQTNRPQVNQGPVIKASAGMSYTSDADSTAAFLALCEAHNIPCQRFVNRSDLRGGSTIGPISSAFVPVRSVDIGTAIWGMHSVRETAGSMDQFYVTALLRAYFESDL